MRRGSADQRRIAFDGRLVGRRRPIDHDLRLRQQQRIGAVEIAAQRRDLVMRRSFQPRQPPARAQQQDRGDDREQQKPGEQDERRDFVPVDAARSALDEFVQGKLGGCRLGRRRAIRSPMHDSRNGHERIRPDHGRAQPPLLRIVSGMPLRLCWPPPPSPAGPSRANRESLDFTLKRNRAERVQIVNAVASAITSRSRDRYCR